MKEIDEFLNKVFNFLIKAIIIILIACIYSWVRKQDDLHRLKYIRQELYENEKK